MCRGESLLQLHASLFQQEVSFMNDSKDRKTITLCDEEECCPTVEQQENTVFIQDDFGGKVALTGDQWNLLVRMIEQKQFADWTFASDRKSTRLNSSHGYISYAVFCLKKKKQNHRYSHNVN